MSNDPTNFDRIDGDVGGTRAFRAGVEIGGDVTPGNIKAGVIRVGRDVRGATLIASGSIDVGGTITGGEDVRCFAAAALRCGDAAGATLIAGERLDVGGSLNDSRVSCGGTVRVGGAIVGGRAAGNAGIRCAVAGAPAGTPTLLAAGVDLYFAACFARHRPDIDRDLDLAARTKEQVTPLMAQLRTLTAAQKESVTISLYEADQLLQSAQQARSSLLSRYTRSRARSAAVIDVARRLHAGVAFQLGFLRAATTETFDGPLQVSIGSDGEKPAILVRQHDGRETILPTTNVADLTVPFHAFFESVAVPNRAA